MRKTIINLLIVIFGLILIGAVLGIRSYFADKNNNPNNNEQPQSIPADIRAHIESKANLIRVTSPEVLANVTSPITVTGEARGTWFFEASFPISVVNWDGLIIGEGYAMADGEWMTEEFVPFTGVIEYTLPPDSYSTDGALIFKKDNPSGLSEYDDALEIPVKL